MYCSIVIMYVLSLTQNKASISAQNVDFNFKCHISGMPDPKGRFIPMLHKHIYYILLPL